MTPEQIRIHEGLKHIGKEIADFYSDAIKLIATNDFNSKSHLIAHLGREISWGLIDILAPKVEKKKCNESGESPTNLERILKAVESKNSEELAKTWSKITQKLPGFAHRRGAWKDTKGPDEVIELWNELEKILLYLTGSYYAITKRIDTICNNETPTDGMIGSLKNLLKNPQLNHYFFHKIDKPNWLEYLIKEGYFEIKNAPISNDENNWPAVWTAISYLKTISKQTSPQIEEKIASVLWYIKDGFLNGKIYLNPWTIADIGEIISALKSYTFAEQDIKFFKKIAIEIRTYVYYEESFLTSMLPNYVQLKSRNGIINLLSYFLGYETIERPAIKISDEITFEPSNEIRDYTPEHRLSQIFGHLKDILQVCGRSAIDIFIDNIRSKFQINAVLFNNSFIPSIEVSSQTSHASAREYLITRFISDGYKYLEVVEQEDLARDLLFNENPLLRRIGFHIVRCGFQELKKLFFDYIKQQTLDASFAIHELYLLIEQRSPEFTDEEFAQTLNWVVEMIDPYEMTSEGDSYKTRKIKRLLTAFQSVQVPQQLLLSQTIQKYGTFDGEHPEFEGYSDSNYVYNEEFDNNEVEQFSSASIRDQVEYLKNYKFTDTFDDNSDLLGIALRDSIVREPSNYLFSMDELLDIPIKYLHRCIEAFTSLQYTDRLTDSSFVTDFIFKIITGSSFISHTQVSSPDYKDWLVSDIGRFLKELCKDDQISSNDIEKMFKILLILLKDNRFNQKFTDVGEKANYTNYIFNSVPGILHDALIRVLAVYKNRLDPSILIKWPNDVKDYFTKTISDEAKNESFAVILGNYFSFLLFVDYEWCSTNFENIFPKSNDKIISNSLGSLLTSNAGHSIREIDLMKKRSLIDFAISKYTAECVQLSGLCRIAVLEYALPDANIESDYIIGQLFNKQDKIQLTQLIASIIQSDRLSDIKIKAIWDRIIQLYDTNNEKYREILSDCTKFVGMLEYIDGNAIQLINESVAALGNNHFNAYYLITTLLKKNSIDLQSLGTIVLNAMTVSGLYSLPEQSIKDLVIRLYDSKLKGIANSICEFIGSFNYLYLRDIYDRYNKPSF